MKNSKKKIKHILENFDFIKVHDTMALLNWTWTTTGDKVPTVKDLKKTAKNLLKNAKDCYPKQPYVYAAIGGFEADRYDGVLTLRFVITDWDSAYYKDED